MVSMVSTVVGIFGGGLAMGAFIGWIVHYTK